jgi:hypothetical protein
LRVISFAALIACWTGTGAAAGAIAVRPSDDSFATVPGVEIATGGGGSLAPPFSATTVEGAMSIAGANNPTSLIASLCLSHLCSCARKRNSSVGRRG